MRVNITMNSIISFEININEHPISIVNLEYNYLPYKQESTTWTIYQQCGANGYVLNECGECGGSGIADGACDCDGNVDAGCGCAEAGPSGCDNACGSTVEVDECGECGGSGIADGACDCDGNTPTDLFGSDNYDCSGAELSLFNGLIPEDFSIHSIYPNPFNPVTNIIYGLLEHVNVQIIVYDLSGKKVATLINQFQTPGYHAVDWDADNLPSGVYLMRMDSGDFTQTRKLMLVK